MQRTESSLSGYLSKKSIGGSWSSRLVYLSFDTGAIKFYAVRHSIVI